MSAIVSIKDLKKVFGKGDKAVTAVGGLTFDVQEGSITGLLGPNGAGKTTTIQMILDLITPTSGSISIFGLDMKHHREEILNKVNFSSPYVSLPSNLKVWENLYTFARLYGVKDIKGKIDELADFFAIRDLLPRKTSSLSTGQLTRLNMTKALLNDPKLLLLDEPTASLDPDIADRTRKLLLRIKKERGITMLYTTHNMEEVDEICDRVIFINKGIVQDDGTPKDLVAKYGRKDLNEVFLHIAREGALEN
jgi:ABC-2 type transport system ATP-binding protein